MVLFTNEQMRRRRKKQKERRERKTRKQKTVWVLFYLTFYRLTSASYWPLTDLELFLLKIARYEGQSINSDNDEIKRSQFLLHEFQISTHVTYQIPSN